MISRHSIVLKKTFFLFISLLLFTTSYGQDRRMLLKEILPGIEQAFEVRFSYLDRDVEGIRILPPDPSLDLQKTLQVLQDRTELTFRLLSHRYIAIIKDTNFDFCGIVLDRREREPLAGANIKIGESRSAVTDAEGRFVLRNISPDTQIQIHYMGYEQVRLTSISPGTNGDCEIIYMDKVVEQLQEALVMNYIT
jgi:hypothetical protein